MLIQRWIIGKDRTKDVKAMNEPQVQFLNRAPAGYSQVVEVRGGRTLYISGQIAVDSSGNVVGSGDFIAQVKQVFANLKARLDEAGASFNDVVKLNFYLVDASGLQIVRDIRDTYVNRENPPASTLVVVKQLVRPELLVEIDAIAVADD
jgi:enamine deaminase RidA (YjgF/YER057c/UK114 family)